MGLSPALLAVVRVSRVEYNSRRGVPFLLVVAKGSFMFRYSLLALAFLALGGAPRFEAAAPKEPPAKKRAPKKPPVKRDATPAEALRALPGFKVELLHTADPATEGSWICMTVDDKGRLLIAGQRRQPILRATLKGGKLDSIQKLDLPISEAMGLLYAFDSLYVNGEGPQGFGLYRCKSTRGDDRFDDVRALKLFHAAGEHGPHGVVLGPDNKIYVMNGNHTDVPAGLAADSPHRNYQEDHLLPRQWDGNGHAAGRLAPGGYVLRTDAEGKRWELVLGGFRNAYDLAFNADGELFTFDSDMEWDWGMPWYRPIRVNHCTSAAEFGWRSGTGKWPDYYPDSLPAVVDVGIGSPTGVVFGTGAKFPAKYQKALYVLDWSYGRVLATHLTPKGSSYTATFENFVAPKSLTGDGAKKPLNLTDVVIGKDGAMYFVTGGRNTPSGLYRVSYTGKGPTAPAKLHDEVGAPQRKLRKELEAFHGKKDAKALAAAWPHLNSADRYLRYAARLAVESQPVAEWKGKALAEKRPTAALTALLALARCGGRDTQADLLTALERFPLAKLSEEQKLDKLRVLQLSFIRQGQPPAAHARRAAAELDGQYPSKNERLNRELAQVLIYLQAPRVLPKTLKLMAEARTQEDQLHYLFHLRTLPIGWWTLEQRKEYFGYWTKSRKKLPHPPELLRWFADAGRPYADGASFPNFLKNFFKEATANLSGAERKALGPLLASIDRASVTTYDVKPRPFVKAWKMADLLPQLDRVDRGRNFNRGREAYFAGQCIKCHRFGNEGGSVGPDLTAVSSRFSRRDVLESILEPSKVVSEQYQNVVVTTNSGKVVVGRLMDENKDRIVLQPDPLAPDQVVLRKADVASREASKVSPMPEHLVDVLTADEVLDLLAYLESSGRRNYRAFRR
jgi:putative heme-binding domain-containing protein